MSTSKKTRTSPFDSFIKDEYYKSYIQNLIIFSVSVCGETRRGDFGDGGEFSIHLFTFRVNLQTLRKRIGQCRHGFVVPIEIEYTMTRSNKHFIPEKWANADSNSQNDLPAFWIWMQKFSSPYTSYS